MMVKFTGRVLPNGWVTRNPTGEDRLWQDGDVCLYERKVKSIHSEYNGLCYKDLNFDGTWRFSKELHKLADSLDINDYSEENAAKLAEALEGHNLFDYKFGDPKPAPPMPVPDDLPNLGLF